MHLQCEVCIFYTWSNAIFNQTAFGVHTWCWVKSEYKQPSCVQGLKWALEIHLSQGRAGIHTQGDTEHLLLPLTGWRGIPQDAARGHRRKESACKAEQLFYSEAE